ncbi:hypothetical protein PYCCODRAFT_1432193 [Trametes coccinea BRFM310]|uniref:Uncharacterized protein n=1 Tax=Trametes coccinea (strain BRFM310) TaxID=1353009 RepID=A0A1Y2IWY1_TRAC3|nr:hypothetical protein PYCCODRAFT_1432193 [Trametes coccinea BRFM310]
MAYQHALQSLATYPDGGGLDRAEYLQQKVDAILHRTYERSREDLSSSSFAALVAVADLRLSDEANSAEVEAILIRGGETTDEMEQESYSQRPTHPTPHVSEARCSIHRRGSDSQVECSLGLSKGDSAAGHTNTVSGPNVYTGNPPSSFITNNITIDHVAERRSDDTLCFPSAVSRHPLDAIQGDPTDAVAFPTFHEEEPGVSGLSEGARRLAYAERYHGHAQWSDDAITPIFSHASTGASMELTWNTPCSISYRYVVIVANEQSSVPLRATLEEVPPDGR